MTWSRLRRRPLSWWSAPPFVRWAHPSCGGPFPLLRRAPCLFEEVIIQLMTPPSLEAVPLLRRGSVIQPRQTPPSLEVGISLFGAVITCRGRPLPFLRWASLSGAVLASHALRAGPCERGPSPPRRPKSWGNLVGCSGLRDPISNQGAIMGPLGAEPFAQTPR
jgi:hypothetical protein